MSFKDLREFLKRLEEIGDLVRIKKQIENGYEASALGWELSERDDVG